METVNGILIWIGANGTLLIAGAIAIMILAIVKGVAVTKPQFEVTSVASDGSRHQVKGSQLYVGPGQTSPNGAQLLESGARIVETMSGDVKRLPGPMREHLGYIDGSVKEE